jgi:hypothetical protein
MKKFCVAVFLFTLVFTGKYLMADFGYQAHPIIANGYFPNNRVLDVPADKIKGTVKVYLKNGKIIYSDGRYFNFKISDLY